jgi:hypothetical protein
VLGKLIREKPKTMKPRIPVLLLAICALATPVLAEPPSTPYADQQHRIIKALSEEEIAALLKGEGLGMAKAAELNGYPGPLHVLTLARELELSPTHGSKFGRFSTG